MKVYQVVNVRTYSYAYEVEAENEDEAVSKLENGGEYADGVISTPEYNQVVENYYQCEGEA